MMLLIIMYMNQTALVSINWYLIWLAFIKYCGSNDEAVAMLSAGETTPLRVLDLIAVTSLLGTIRMGIVGSMMVST